MPECSRPPEGLQKLANQIKSLTTAQKFTLAAQAMEIHRPDLAEMFGKHALDELLAARLFGRTDKGGK